MSPICLVPILNDIQVLSDGGRATSGHGKASKAILQTKLVNSLKLFVIEHSLLKWDKSIVAHTKPVLGDMK